MVEWKKLGDFGTFENIGTDKKIVQGEKLVTLLNYVDVYHNKYIDSSIPQMQVSASDKKIQSCTVEKGDIFVTPTSETIDDIGHSSVITETIDNAVYSYHIMRYRLFETNMLFSYYINYCFDTYNVKKQILKKAQGLTRFGLSKDKFASIQIPIPSLEEQNRIVGILDTFTDSIENLKQQIAQRRKQYEHYRDQLLDLEGKEGVEMKTLGKICNNLDFKRKPITGSKRVAGIYPYYGASGIVDYVESYIFDGEYLLVSEDGANLLTRTTPIAFSIKGKNWVNNHAHVLEFDNKTTQKFVEIFLNMIDLSPWINGAAQPKLNQANLNIIEIPLPPLPEQQRIVSILDTFEASISNLEAQLAQRQKQYEYYRNQLLTFE